GAALLRVGLRPVASGVAEAAGEEVVTERAGVHPEVRGDVLLPAPLAVGGDRDVGDRADAGLAVDADGVDVDGGRRVGERLACDGEVAGDDALGPGLRGGAGRLVGGADTVFHGCSSWLSRGFG